MEDIDPTIHLAPKHLRNIKKHLLKRIDERFNVDVSKSDLKYFQSILKQAGKRDIFTSDRKDRVIRYQPSILEFREKDDKMHRSCFLIVYENRLVCLHFEEYILKTVMRPANRHIRYWNARNVKNQFPLNGHKRTSKADRIQKLIDRSNDKIVKRANWLKYHADIKI